MKILRKIHSTLTGDVGAMRDYIIDKTAITKTSKGTQKTTTKLQISNIDIVTDPNNDNAPMMTVEEKMLTSLVPSFLLLQHSDNFKDCFVPRSKTYSVIIVS